MKKGLWTGIVLAILMVAYFHFFNQKREHKIVEGEKERRKGFIVQKGEASTSKREEKPLHSSNGKAKRPPQTISSLWIKNRLAVMKALRSEKDNFGKLEVISDSVATWRISQKYRGIHKNNFVQGTPFVARIGRYYVVEREAGEKANIVYGVEKGGMGVVSGSLMVKVQDGRDAELLLERWEQDEELEVGLTFLHIGVVELITSLGDNIAQVAKRLALQKGVERVKIDVIEEDTHSFGS